MAEPEAAPKEGETQTPQTTPKGTPSTIAIGTTSPPGEANPTGQDDGDAGKQSGNQAETTTPEKYDFSQLGEGITIDQGLADAFSEVAREQKFSQETAANLARWYATKVVPMQEAQVAEQVKAWTEQIQSDAVMGGAKFQETLTTNGRVMAHVLKVDQARGQELHELLSGPIGNHPAVAWFISQVVGPLLTEPKPIPGGAPAQAQPKGLEHAFGYKS